MKDKKNETKKSLLTGFISGLLSSLCCVTPLVLVLLGLSGVAGAMGLAGFLQQNLRWTLFIPLGLIFLGSSIYLYIRKKEGTCNLKTIQKYKTFVITTILFAVIVWILLIYVIVPYIFGLLT
jgi:hypothetical protein|tara:strand:+ start:314 stop:679 length:366 start_codon:yes stop_codon:yes gene_type:complete